MSDRSLVPVDFSNADENGAIRLVTRGTIEYLDSRGIKLVPGLSIVMTDGELVAEGECEQCDGMWVARVTRWIS